jgi:hypothetical protein
MKKLLLPVLLCISTLLFGQQKTADFIKKHLYVKISPTLFAGKILGNTLYPNDDGNGATPAIFEAVGVKIRWAALGFSAGYFKSKHAGNIVPWGVDLTIADFKRKVSPVITAQWHQTQYTANYSLPGNGIHYSNVSGKDMYSFGAGVAFTVLKRSKLLATLGFSRLNYNEEVTHSITSGPYGTFVYYYKEHLNKPFIAVSWVW